MKTHVSNHAKSDQIRYDGSDSDEDFSPVLPFLAEKVGEQVYDCRNKPVFVYMCMCVCVRVGFAKSEMTRSKRGHSMP